MADTPKSLIGQLSDTPDSALYTVPAATTTLILKLTYCETSGAEIAVNAYLRKSGTSRRIMDKNYALPSNESRDISNAQKHVLETGDSIRGDAATGSAVDWVLSIVEFS
jgi:hypothetical protein